MTDFYKTNKNQSPPCSGQLTRKIVKICVLREWKRRVPRSIKVQQLPRWTERPEVTLKGAGGNNTGEGEGGLPVWEGTRTEGVRVWWTYHKMWIRIWLWWQIRKLRPQETEASGDLSQSAAWGRDIAESQSLPVLFLTVHHTAPLLFRDTVKM